MKIKYQIFLLVIIISNSTICQEFLAEPEKDVSVIILKTKKNADQNIIDFGKHLVINGYTIESKDSEYMTLITGPKTPKAKRSYNYKLIINFKDDMIYVRAKQSEIHRDPLTGYLGDTRWYDWSYKKKKSHDCYKAYYDFLPNLESYCTNILYLKD